MAIVDLARETHSVQGLVLTRLDPGSLRLMRSRIRRDGLRLGISGRITLCPDGLALIVCGEPAAIQQFMALLCEWPCLAGIGLKPFSSPGADPDGRLDVRIRSWMTDFRESELPSLDGVVTGISPGDFHRRVKDSGHGVRLIDVREAHETRFGSFKGAVCLETARFDDLPEAFSSMGLTPDHHISTVVFCDDGSRSARAALFLQSRGFGQVYFLEGGILNYFSAVGGHHFNGHCFVMDQRVAVDANGVPARLDFCRACGEVRPADQFEPASGCRGSCCPECRRVDTAAMVAQRRTRDHEIQGVTSPLPGSVPYENLRPLKVPESAAGMPVLEFLDRLKFRPPEQSWSELMELGQLSFAGKLLNPDDILPRGGRIVHKVPATSEPPVNADITVVHEDESLLIINKPAPLPVHPSGRFNRNTLLHILRLVYGAEAPRSAHRLDANTCGVMALTRTREAASVLQPQFEAGRVNKSYLAVVHGHPEADRFECDAPVSRESTMAGGRAVDPDGLSARTGFEVIRRLPGNRSLLRIRLLHGGRTHQIRLHLWHLGFPVDGDPLYLPDGRRGQIQTIDPLAQPMCLQSSTIEFVHPTRRRLVHFEAPPPPWMPND